MWAAQATVFFRALERHAVGDACATRAPCASSSLLETWPPFQKDGIPAHVSLSPPQSRLQTHATVREQDWVASRAAPLRKMWCMAESSIRTETTQKHSWLGARCVPTHAANLLAIAPPSRQRGCNILYTSGTPRMCRMSHMRRLPWHTEANVFPRLLCMPRTSHASHASHASHTRLVRASRTHLACTPRMHARLSQDDVRMRRVQILRNNHGQERPVRQ